MLAVRVCAWTTFGVMSAGAAISQTQDTAAPSAAATQAAGPQMSGAAPQHWNPPVTDNRVYTHMLFNQLEGRSRGQGNALRWDGEAWMGADMNRLWIKSEGYLKGSTLSDGDHEVLYDRPIPRMRYFDAQVGVREDLDSGANRTWGAVGIEGLAPHFFEFEPTFYFRDDGNIAGRVTGSYDLLLTQRLVAQPEFELNFYNKSDPTRGNGSGLSDLDFGIRIRYDIRRKFAPYVGFAYAAKYGDAATFAHRQGEFVASPTFVFGLRVWR
jgi:copper resistance protein B